MTKTGSCYTARTLTAILRTLQEHGHLGQKTGQGFYKTVVDGQGAKSFWGLDLQAAADGRLEYVAARQAALGQRRRSAEPAVDRAAALRLWTPTTAAGRLGLAYAGAAPWPMRPIAFRRSQTASRTSTTP